MGIMLSKPFSSGPSGSWELANLLPLSQVTLGAFGHEEEVISNPLSPRVIKDIIYKCNPHDERAAVIQQELVIHIGWAIANSPELFSGMLKIRVG